MWTIIRWAFQETFEDRFADFKQSIGVHRSSQANNENTDHTTPSLANQTPPLGVQVDNLVFGLFKYCYPLTEAVARGLLVN